MPSRPNQNRKIGRSWVAASVILVAIAQLSLKTGVSMLAATHSLTLATLQTFDFSSVDIRAVAAIGAGLSCYLISVICWLRALELLPLNITYPLLSLSYPLVYFGAMGLPLLHESFNVNRTAGVLLIMLGVVLLAPDKNHEQKS